MAPGDKPKVSVTLENEAGEQKYVSVEDAWLIENGLDIGSVWPDEGDWTMNCNSKTVDIPAFISKIQDMKAGKDVYWKCPFCGGKVILYENEGGHTEIGCSDCDMRINLESN